MPISINGTGTITGVSVGGLPDGIVDTDMLATNAVSSAKIQTGAAGGILQIVSDNDNVDSSYSLSAYGVSSDVLSVSITPTFSNSKMLIMTHVMGGTDYDIMSARLMKDGSVMDGPNGDATDASNRIRAYTYAHFVGTSTTQQMPLDTVYLETLSGASTSTAITYSVRLINTDNASRTVYLNRGSNDTDQSVNRTRTSSSLIVMEIAP